MTLRVEKETRDLALGEGRSGKELQARLAMLWSFLGRAATQDFVEEEM